MATPEAQNNSSESHRPVVASRPDTPGVGAGNWFSEFERLEKVFAVLGGLLFIGMLMAYLGSSVENDFLLGAGVGVISSMLIGMASLFIPLNWIFLKGFLARRRRRAAERAEDI